MFAMFTSAMFQCRKRQEVVATSSKERQILNRFKCFNAVNGKKSLQRKNGSDADLTGT